MKPWPNAYISAIERWPLQIRVRDGHVAATHKSNAVDSGVAVFVVLCALAVLPALFLYQVASHFGSSRLLLTSLPFVVVLVFAIRSGLRTHRTLEWDVFTVWESGTIRACVPGMWSIDIEEYTYDRHRHALALSKVHHRLQPNWPDKNWLGLNPMCVTLVLSFIERDNVLGIVPLVQRKVLRRPLVAHGRYMSKVQAMHRDVGKFTGELAHILGVPIVDAEDFSLNTSRQTNGSETNIES